MRMSNITAWKFATVCLTLILLAGCGGKASDRAEKAIGKGETYLRAGLFKEALTQYQEAYNLDPSKTEILLGIGECYEQLGLYTDAANTYNDLIKIGGNSTAEAIKRKTLLLIRTDKINEANSFLGEMAGRQDIQTGLLDYLRGEIARKQNNLIAAEEFFLNALKARPDFIEPANALATVYQQKGNINEAIQILQPLVEKNPENFVSVINLASLYDKNNQPLKAIDILGKLVQAQPRNPYAHAYLARLYLNQNQDADAENAVKNALSISPNEPIALYVSGQLALKRGDAEKAYKDLESAIQRDPANPEIQNAFREAQIQTGRLVDRVKKIQDEIVKKGESIDLIVQLGEGYLYQGEFEQALTQVHKARSQDPENQAAKILELKIYACLGTFPEVNQILPSLEGVDNPFITTIRGLVTPDLDLTQKGIAQLKGATETAAWGKHFTAISYIQTNRPEEALKELDGLVNEYEDFGLPVYLLASIYERMKEPQLAMVLYQKLATRFPESKKPPMALAQLLASLNRGERARVLLDGVIKRDPTFQPARMLLGTILLQSRKFSEASDVFRNLISDATEEPVSRIMFKSFLAKTLVFERKYEDASRVYDEILSEQPNLTPAYIEKSLASLVSRNYEKALEICDVGMNAATETRTLKVVRAVVLQQLNRAGEGIPVVESELAQQQPDSPATNHLTALLIGLYASNKQFDEARKKAQSEIFRPRLREYIQESIDKIEKENRDLSRLNVAILFSYYFWPDAALAVYTELFEKYPDDRLLLSFLAEAQAMVGQIENAYTTYSKGVALAPDDPNFLQEKAALAAKLNKPDEAIKDFLSAAAITPEDPFLRFRLAEVYQQQGLAEDAIEAYRNVVNLNPEPILLSSAANNLAYLLSMNPERLDEAEKYALMALEVAPILKQTNAKDGNIFDTVGWIYFLKKDFEKAKEYLFQGLQTIPSHPTINYHIGRVFEETQDPKVAVLFYLKALDFSPEFPEAEDAKLRLTRLSAIIGPPGTN